MENPSRLDVQVKQVKSLLSEFRKTKMKCLQLCERLNRDLPNLLQYEVMEVTCTRRIDSFDLLGVLKLKKELLANLGEISELERDMTYEMQKNSFKKALKVTVPPKLSREPSVIPEEVGPFEIPTYQSRQQPNDCKVDRLAAFILALGRSMSTLRKCIIGEWEWDEENFYKYEPEYIEVLRRIEQFRMRDEELIQIVENRVQKEMQEILKKGERVQSEEQGYDLIKIPVKVVQRAIEGQKLRKGKGQEEKPYHPVSMIEPKRKALPKKMPLEKINEEKAGDSERIQLPKFASDNSLDLPSTKLNNTHSRIGNRLMQEQEGEENNYVYMVKRISPDSQLNSSITSSISSLRSMRKKVFDDDIWDEFEKI